MASAMMIGLRGRLRRRTAACICHRGRLIRRSIRHRLVLSVDSRADATARNAIGDLLDSPERLKIHQQTFSKMQHDVLRDKAKKLQEEEAGRQQEQTASQTQGQGHGHGPDTLGDEVVTFNALFPPGVVPMNMPAFLLGGGLAPPATGAAPGPGPENGTVPPPAPTANAGTPISGASASATAATGPVAPPADDAQDNGDGAEYEEGEWTDEDSDDDADGAPQGAGAGAGATAHAPGPGLGLPLGAVGLPGGGALPGGVGFAGMWGGRKSGFRSLRLLAHRSIIGRVSEQNGKYREYG